MVMKFRTQKHANLVWVMTPIPFIYMPFSKKTPLVSLPGTKQKINSNQTLVPSMDCQPINIYHGSHILKINLFNTNLIKEKEFLHNIV